MDGGRGGRGGTEDAEQDGGGKAAGRGKSAAPDGKEEIGKALDELSGAIDGMLDGQGGGGAGEERRAEGSAQGSRGGPAEPQRGTGQDGPREIKEQGQPADGAKSSDPDGGGRRDPPTPDPIPDPVIESILGPSEVAYDGRGGGGGADGGSDGGGGGRTYAYEDFIDERVLISRDAFGRKEMKIKVIEVSDEKAPTSWKLGDRVKVSKILVTVKHLETQQVEECEFDIEAIEAELARERHYSSTNRWVPTTDIKNGYVSGSRHTSLISDAVALDYITF